MKPRGQVRLSLDLPLAMHKSIKMRAARRGLTMREYILEALVNREEGEKEERKGAAVEELDDVSFRNELEKLRKEKYQLAKRLSQR